MYCLCHFTWYESKLRFIQMFAGLTTSIFWQFLLPPTTFSCDQKFLRLSQKTLDLLMKLFHNDMQYVNRSCTYKIALNHLVRNVISFRLLDFQSQNIDSFFNFDSNRYYLFVYFFVDFNEHYEPFFFIFKQKLFPKSKFVCIISFHWSQFH